MLQPFILSLAIALQAPGPFDYETVEADRLTFAWALAAANHGAVIANHVEATRMLAVDSGGRRRVAGVRARDRLSGRELEIGAQVTVNATGGAVDRLLEPLGLSARAPLLKALNLVTRRPGGEHALGGRAASGRHLFVVPWRGRALFGTWESGQASTPDARLVSEAEVMSFIGELNQAFPSLVLKIDEVALVHRGLVPAVAGGDGRLSLQGRERMRDHASEGVEGLVTIAGTKYTTARAVAERVTDRLAAKLHRAVVPCRTAATPLPGGDLRDVLDLASSQPAWSQPVADGSPVIGAQLIWAVRQEMAVTLCDAVVRRTMLGALGHPGDGAAKRVARLIGGELHWSEQRVREELATLRRFYAFDGPDFR